MKTFNEIYKLKEDVYYDREQKDEIRKPESGLIRKWEDWAEKTFPGVDCSPWDCECFLAQDDIHDDVTQARYFITFIYDAPGPKFYGWKHAVANDAGKIEQAYGISSHASGPRRTFAINVDNSIFAKSREEARNAKCYEMEWID